MRWEREMRLRESARGAASRCSAEILNGRYRLDGLLGSGGAADVYRGFDLRLKRSVAVKVFRPDTGFDVEENSHGEAVILARLHHPGLVAAYDAGRHHERVFLVMQLIEGTTLKHRIAKGPLAFGETAVLGSHLARALAHAHEANIVHRDVKPSNILLDAAQHPYLTDFGISRLLDTTTRTATGTLTGTAAYLSPEQVLGQPVGRPADIYALGLVLLECLTGRLEYDGAPLEAAIARLHRKPAIPDHVPPRLADIVRAMTALDGSDRPAAYDGARALTEAAEAEPRTGPFVEGVSHAPDLGRASRVSDRTHRKPLHGGGQTSPRPPAARRRSLAVAASAALAAVTAVALVISDNSASHGGDPSSTQSTSVPTSAADKDATASAEKSPTARPSDGTRTDVEPERKARPAAEGPDPAADSDTGPATTAHPTPSPAGLPGATAHDRQKTETSPLPPGQAKKKVKGAKDKKTTKAGKAP
ncbi:protein kinase [Streptomyces sp. NPDC006333]|uniref:serine/threonine-protein kinase n=1 Tax=Streptomyces sp. NPDC006333 TaxID=3156753 RepID=UPI0033BAE169